MNFAFGCGHGHVFIAREANGEVADLEGCFCPLCLGKIVGHGDIIEPRMLAPLQSALQLTTDQQASDPGAKGGTS